MHLYTTHKHLSCKSHFKIGQSEFELMCHLSGYSIEKEVNSKYMKLCVILGAIWKTIKKSKHPTSFKRKGIMSNILYSKQIRGRSCTVSRIYLRDLFALAQALPDLFLRYIFNLVHRRVTQNRWYIYEWPVNFWATKTRNFLFYFSQQAWIVKWIECVIKDNLVLNKWTIIVNSFKQNKCFNKNITSGLTVKYYFVSFPSTVYYSNEKISLM